MQTEGVEENQCLTSRKQQYYVPEIQKNVSFFELLRYSTQKEKVMMVIGGLAAVCNGASHPMFYLVFGKMINSFSNSGEELVEKAGMNAIYFIIAAGCTMVLSFIMFATWMITGENQSIEFRKRYFAALLKQEIGWHDTINPNELNAKVTNETCDIQGAIGEKVPTFIMTLCNTFFGFLIAFIYGWQLALVVTSVLPVISITMAIFAINFSASETATQKAYLDASALAEQALNAIKTVKMLDGEDYEVEKYKKLLMRTRSTVLHYQFRIGMSIGLLWASMIWAYALGFWYGAKLISDQTINHNIDGVYTAEDVIIIFFEILIGGFALGQSGPCIQSFAKGKQAALNMFQILDRVPKIANPQNGDKLTTFNGEILFKNIKFSYPNRPEQQILKGLNLMIPGGKKVALVGESGCGKSTVIQLIERFYDCDSGQILFGGTNGFDIKDIDLYELRNNIGLVGQEPVLFSTSIKQNLLYGKENATDEELIEALKRARAWEFVSKLEKGIDTQVGMGGGQLSGGQKQRIAIARAILKKPKVLLLDEATSALDSTNERLIQETLDEVFKNITIIVVAHRLSTIQNADLIYVIDQGIVVEKGTHSDLILQGGKYATLAQNQFQTIIQEKSINSYTSIALNKKEKDQSINLGSQRSVQLNMDKLGEQNIFKAIKEEIDVIKEFQPMPSQNKQSERELNCVTYPTQIKYNDSQIQKVEVDEKQQEQADLSEQMSRLFAYNKEGTVILILGIVISLLNGCIFPIFSQFLAQIITLMIESNPLFAIQKCHEVYINPTDELCQEVKQQLKEDVRNEADSLALQFFLIGFISLFLWTLQQYILTFVGQQITYKLSQETYRKLLRMPVSYFDNSTNNAGTLTNRLTVNCRCINNIYALILGLNISSIGALISGIVISFMASWQITLIQLGLVPLQYLGGILQAKFVQGYSDQTDTAYKDSGNLIMEAMTNMRTVVSLGNDQIMLKLYSQKVELPLIKAQKRGIYAGLALGVGKMQLFIINAVIFYVGALLCKINQITFENMLKSIQAIDYATWSAGHNAAYAGDVGAAKQASKSIFQILDSEDEFQKQERLNKKKITTPIKGDIHFNNISFKYQNRDKNVFSNLSLIIKQGQKAAFVGPSGCGKSTLMQMLMRFYDPDSGVITLDGIDITEYDIKHLRRQFGIVSQEPVLFNATIKENIQYNISDAKMEDIEIAAKLANAYDFITKNQFEEIQAGDQENQQSQKGQGFDRQVGPKGTQISGGQKQRIAIARAILRNSSVLLLDEATSALDSASEIIVKDSLNNLMKDKTSISIAHRISTIKDSNQIYVFDEGQIVEEGNYQSLTKKKGFFFRLQQGSTH